MNKSICEFQCSTNIVINWYFTILDAGDDAESCSTPKFVDITP